MYTLLFCFVFIVHFFWIAVALQDRAIAYCYSATSILMQAGSHNHQTLLLASMLARCLATWNQMCIPTHSYAVLTSVYSFQHPSIMQEWNASFWDQLRSFELVIIIGIKQVSCSNNDCYWSGTLLQCPKLLTDYHSSLAFEGKYSYNSN